MHQMHKRNLSVDQNVKEMPMAYGFAWISYALSLRIAYTTALSAYAEDMSLLSLTRSTREAM